MVDLSIDDIRERCRKGAIRWSAHSASRMLQRSTTHEGIVNCILNGEIIEQYPEH